MGFYVLIVNDEGQLGADSESPFFSEGQAMRKEEDYVCLAETIEADSLTEAKRIFRKRHPEYLNKNFRKGIAAEALD